jgi:hypothetical protein
MTQPTLPAITLDENGAALINATVTDGGGGGLGDYENVVVVAKSGADYSTVSTGEAACSTSDLLAIMPGVYNENVTLDVQFVTMLGFGGAKDSGIVQLGGDDDVGPILDLDNDVNVVWMHITRTLSGGAGDFIGIDASGAFHTHLQQCYIDLDGAATGRDVTGVKMRGDGTIESTIVQCRIFMSNESSGEAVDLCGGGVDIEGCEIDGDVVCSAATTTRIRSTRIDGDLTGVAGADLYLQDVHVTGTISGWDNVYIEGADSDPGANARVLATDADGLLTLHEFKVTDSATNKPEVEIENTNDDANPAALLFIKDSASPADGDWLGAIDFYGNDDGDNQVRFVTIGGKSADVTDGGEGGELVFNVWMDDNQRELLRLSGYNGSVNQGEVVINDDSQDVDLRWESDGDAYGLFCEASSGKIFINESANAEMTIGLTINQDDNDDEIISLKSSDVAHGMTDETETDTFCAIEKNNVNAGGLQISGFRDANGLGHSGVSIFANVSASGLTAKSTSGFGIARIVSAVKSGTGVTNVNSGGNLLSVEDDGTVRAIFGQDGDLYLDTALNENAWDAHDDLALLHGLRASLVPDGHELKRRFGQWIEYARPILERTGVITYNDDGHHFIATKKLQMLTIDAVRQMYERIEELEQKLEAIQ